MEKSIWREHGFSPFVAIAFVNAFTDLGHKIVIQNALFKMLDGTELRVYTAIIQAMILLPFIMTFTPAGYIAARFAISSLGTRQGFPSLSELTQHYQELYSK